VDLVSDHAGIAILTQPMARGIHTDGVVVKPLSDASLCFKTCLILRADNSSRLVNEYGSHVPPQICAPATTTKANCMVVVGLSCQHQKGNRSAAPLTAQHPRRGAHREFWTPFARKRSRPCCKQVLWSGTVDAELWTIVRPRKDLNETAWRLYSRIQLAAL
jgi:hypothetical protein